MVDRSPRSGTRSDTRPDHVVFVVDECLGGNLVRVALEGAGAVVKLVRDEFGEGAQDVDWLPEVGRRGWIVLTKDQRIRRRPAERAAFVTARARGFFLAAEGLRGPEVAELFAGQLPRMRKLVQQYTAPFIAIVRRDGIIMYDGDDCPAVRRGAKRRDR